MQKVKVEPFMLIGISIRTTNENAQSSIDIAGLWQKFLGENILDKIPGKLDDTVYSLYTEYESDHTKPYTTIIGCKVSDLSAVPQGMIGKKFDGGDYIKTSARGNIMKNLVVDEWSRIFELDIERAYSADFEVFGEKAKDPANAEVDFYIATK